MSVVWIELHFAVSTVTIGAGGTSAIVFPEVNCGYTHVQTFCISTCYSCNSSGSINPGLLIFDIAPDYGKFYDYGILKGSCYVYNNRSYTVTVGKVVVMGIGLIYK